MPYCKHIIGEHTLHLIGNRLLIIYDDLYLIAEVPNPQYVYDNIQTAKYQAFYHRDEWIDNYVSIGKYTYYPQEIAKDQIVAYLLEAVREINPDKIIPELVSIIGNNS